MQNFIRSVSRGAEHGFLNKNRHFIQRWPTKPKYVVIGHKNFVHDDSTQRLAIDLGVPVISMQQLVSEVIDNGADSGCEFRKQAALIL